MLQLGLIIIPFVNTQKCMHCIYITCVCLGGVGVRVSRCTVNTFNAPEHIRCVLLMYAFVHFFFIIPITFD